MFVEGVGGKSIFVMSLERRFWGRLIMSSGKMLTFGGGEVVFPIV